ncbi:hypothetical protein [Novipirellula caenicola]|uniref:Secreted protein n=1 Tax=Novipirellula caenicola TaxID=1536901 RepID=A0ABP9VU41_9BACT
MRRPLFRPQQRISLISFVVVLMCLSHSGCGGDTATSPSSDELSEYVSENPHDFDSGATLDNGNTTE